MPKKIKTHLKPYKKLIIGISVIILILLEAYLHYMFDFNIFLILILDVIFVITYYNLTSDHV